MTRATYRARRLVAETWYLCFGAVLGFGIGVFYTLVVWLS